MDIQLYPLYYLPITISHNPSRHADPTRGLIEEVPSVQARYKNTVYKDKQTTIVWTPGSSDCARMVNQARYKNK